MPMKRATVSRLRRSQYPPILIPGCGRLHRLFFSFNQEQFAKKVAAAPLCHFPGLRALPSNIMWNAPRPIQNKKADEHFNSPAFSVSLGFPLLLRSCSNRQRRRRRRHVRDWRQLGGWNEVLRSRQSGRLRHRRHCRHLRNCGRHVHGWRHRLRQHVRSGHRFRHRRRYWQRVLGNTFRQSLTRECRSTGVRRSVRLVERRDGLRRHLVIRGLNRCRPRRWCIDIDRGWNGVHAWRRCRQAGRHLRRLIRIHHVRIHSAGGICGDHGSSRVVAHPLLWNR